MSATDPQQRTVLLPLTKCATLDKPLCCSVRLGVTCNIMIDGRVRRAEPCCAIVSNLERINILVRLSFIASVENVRTERSQRTCARIFVSNSAIPGVSGAAVYWLRR